MKSARRSTVGSSGAWREPCRLCGLDAVCLLLELRHLGFVTGIIDDGFRDGPHDYPARYTSRNKCRAAAWLFAAADDIVVDVEISHVGANREAVAKFALHTAHDSAGAVRSEE